MNKKKSINGKTIVAACFVTLFIALIAIGLTVYFINYGKYDFKLYYGYIGECETLGKAVALEIDKDDFNGTIDDFSQAQYTLGVKLLKPGAGYTITDDGITVSTINCCVTAEYNFTTAAGDIIGCTAHYMRKPMRADVYQIKAENITDKHANSGEELINVYIPEFDDTYTLEKLGCKVYPLIYRNSDGIFSSTAYFVYNDICYEVSGVKSLNELKYIVSTFE